MNKAEFVSHVATETSTIKAAAEWMVGAVFSAIADPPARDQPVAIAGFGKLAVRGRAARQGRNPRTGEPVAVPMSKVPSFKLAKALRDAVNKLHDEAGGHMLAIRFRNAPAAHACARHADLQNLVAGITSASDALSVAGHPIADYPLSTGYGSFVAGKCRRAMINPSLVRTHSPFRAIVDNRLHATKIIIL